MSSDNFDNEVSKLYQQRKAQIIVPQIDLKQPSKTRRLSTTALLSIFSAAGIASFGIMAIISHLSNSQVKKAINYNASHQIEVTKIIPIKEVEKTVSIQQPLPPKPIIKQPKETSPPDIKRQVNQSYIAPESIGSGQVQIITLPQLKEPKLAVKPVYKVLPKYALNSLQSKRSAKIQLKYKITPAGEVENIIIVKSSVNRKLQLAAKKALAQWQYAPNNNFKESYEIIFEFK